MDTRSVETTIVGVRICKFVTHSEVNKSISQRQTNFYRFSEIISIRVHRLSEVNAATLKLNSTFLRGSFDYYSLQLAHVWASQRRLEDFRRDYECRRWMRRVFDSSRSLLFKPLSSQGVCEPLMSKSYARSFDQTYELTYEHSSAKVRMNQT